MNFFAIIYNISKSITLEVILTELRKNSQQLNNIERECASIKEELRCLLRKVDSKEKETFKIEKSSYQVYYVHLHDMAVIVINKFRMHLIVKLGSCLYPR